MSNGKGSARRPCQVSREEYDSHWDAVFPPPTPRQGGMGVGGVQRLIEHEENMPKTEAETLSHNVDEHREQIEDLYQWCLESAKICFQTNHFGEGPDDEGGRE